jgi:hypothetical protein
MFKIRQRLRQGIAMYLDGKLQRNLFTRLAYLHEIKSLNSGLNNLSSYNA